MHKLPIEHRVVRTVVDPYGALVPRDFTKFECAQAYPEYNAPCEGKKTRVPPKKPQIKREEATQGSHLRNKKAETDVSKAQHKIMALACQR